MENDYSIELDYSFRSALGEIESYRYINEYKVNIYNNEDGLEDSRNRELIGKARLSLVLLSLVINNQMDTYEVFDNSQFLMELGETIFDFETDDFREPLIDEVCASSSNLLVIDRLELLPAWRKKGFGKKIIKDIIWRFSGCCDLVVLKAFPLQKEATNPDKEKSEWQKKMEMTNLPKDGELSFYKVYAYYQNLGFEQYEETDYFYFNPAKLNEKFDAIDIEE